VKQFVLGFLTASALALGAYYVWLRPRPEPAPSVSEAAPSEAKPTAVDRRHRRRGGGGTAAVALRPEDLRPGAEGDDLRTPDVVDLTQQGGGELSQEDVDARVRARQSELLACIEAARPSPDALITGQVTVRFRIQRSGTVRGVRVEAPAVLLRGGLYRCMRPIITGLRFSASGESLVMSYPFQLE
jgi:hypothetical protein